jgi:heterodisulfide reductase subunit A2
MEHVEQGQEGRVGVYICHCGGNISDVVDVKRAMEMLREESSAAVVRDYPFMCSDPGQGLIIEDIKRNAIDRVVVAACSPALHELTFRNALGRAGLNPYLYEHVNIREQVSWVHKEAHEKATEKAVRLIRAGIEKVMLQDPLHAIQVNAEPSVLVIGAGVAGMQSALSLARRGLKVTIIEKEASPGGHLKELRSLFPTGDDAAVLIDRLTGEIRGEENITLLLDSQVAEIGGYVGNFSVKTDTGRELRAGALIVATGFRHYRPFEGELGFHAGSPHVVTLPEFIRNMPESPSREGCLTYEGRLVRNLAFVHCVGSMQRDGIHRAQPDGHLNDYCSRYCCGAVLHTINRVLDHYPATQIYDIHRDMRTYARGHEQYYEDAAKKGALFFRYADDSLPVIAVRQGSCAISLRDMLTWGEEVLISADLVVLATAMMPGEHGVLVDSLKLPLGTDRFLLEVHPKLRPVELANNGVFVAGACQGPMTIPEACASAEAASVKASILLSSPTITIDPFVARVDERLCDGCGLCALECSYRDALVLADRELEGISVKRASVNPAVCVGCGACAAVCPHRAIAVAGWTLDQFDAMIDAITAPIAR